MEKAPEGQAPPSLRICPPWRRSVNGADALFEIAVIYGLGCPFMMAFGFLAV